MVSSDWHQDAPDRIDQDLTAGDDYEQQHEQEADGPRCDTEPRSELHPCGAYTSHHHAARRSWRRSIRIDRRHDRLGALATSKRSDERTYKLDFTSMGAFPDAVDQGFRDALA